MKKQDWHNDIIYQIYPKSFLDSNGDGIGDIPGIISKLDYLKELGVDDIWLSPVFVSPMKDNGYDIADYRHIDPIFGTDEDMDCLLKEAKKRNLGIILDLVVNHTSSENPYFIEAKKSKDNPYRNYYIWRDHPNSLQSTFSGSAWEFDKATNQYYLHLFTKEQPDLNWSNPELREKIYAMMNFWLDKGVKGFRMDVIEDIGKEPDFEVVANGPHLHDYIHEMNQRTFGPRGCIAIGECWNSDNENRILYLDPKREELSMVFQFDQITCFWDSKYGKWFQKPFDAKLLRNHIFAHENKDQDKVWNALFWENHDLPRSTSIYAKPLYRKDAAKMLLAINLFLKGTPFIYQGEELGMENGELNMSDIEDIESINIYHSLMEDSSLDKEEIEQNILKISRDNARTPMQWNDSKNAGFSTGKPWIKVADSLYSIRNVEEESHDPSSVLSFLKTAIKLRKNPKYKNIIIDGSFSPLYEENPTSFAFKRSLGNKSIYFYANFSSEPSLIPSSLPLNKIILSNGITKAMINPYGFIITYK
jgi:glycosidase